MNDPWTPSRLLQWARSFQESRLLLTAAELDLFTLLANGPRSVEEIAATLGLDIRAAAIFLDALAALGLLEKLPEGYGTPKDLVGPLSSGSDSAVLPMVRHAASLWRRWGDLTHVLRSGFPDSASGWEARSPEDREAFIGAMHVIGRELAPQIVSSVPLGGVRRLLDVGGGSGTYTMAFLRASAELRVTLLDLPPVIALARTRLEAEGLSERVDLRAGDFEKDPLPEGHDMAFLSAIVHQNSREQNRALFRNVRSGLIPGGRIVIRDHVMEPSRTVPVAGALFAVNMLVATRGGSTYTLQELKEDLEASGFRQAEQIRHGDKMDCLILAIRS